MTGPILLDVTRMAAWHWRGVPATGIDRVCHAYARHFGDRANAAIQIAGRVGVLDRVSSRRMFEAFEGTTAGFRRTCPSLVSSLRFVSESHASDRAVYLNVGHSGFDLRPHWRSFDRVRARRAYLLHDLIPITHPHLTTAHKTARHRGRVRSALLNADAIVVPLQATADSLEAFAQSEGIASPPVLVAPIAASPLPKVEAEPDPANPFFLSVGTVEPRKNHAVLLRAWSQLIDRMGDSAPKLVIAGKRGLSAGEILSPLQNDPRLRRFVQVRSGLSDRELGELLAASRALLFPTLAEGFGLPLAEALHAGVPVLASDLPALREVGQGIPTLLDPVDESGWASAIAAHCGESAERTRQLAAIPRFRATTWDDHFAGLEEWLANLGTARLDRSETGRVEKARGNTIRRDRELQC